MGWMQTGSKRVRALAGWCFLVCLAVALVPGSSRAQVWEEAFVFHLEEYSFSARTGVLALYRHTELNLTAAVMDVEQICVPDSVALAGGVAVGWLAELYAADSSLAARLNPLGIVSQETLVDSEILAETSDIMFWLWPNMGPRNYTSAFVAYYGESLGDGSYGVNDLCFSQDVKEEGIFGALFNAPFPDFGTAGDWIGDFIVCGEVTDSCQWYGIYRTPK